MKIFDKVSATRPTGLVIVFPIGVKGLFNPTVHRLVRKVEEELEGVHVNYALSSGASPTVSDALAAARFAGCEAAVVVAADERVLDPSTGLGSSGDWSLFAEAGEISADSVVDAYQTALVRHENAA